MRNGSAPEPGLLVNSSALSEALSVVLTVRDPESDEGPRRV